MEGIVIGLLGTIATVIISIATLAYWLGRKFVQIEARFVQVEDRFRGIDERFKQIDNRFAQIESRLDHIEARLSKVESRLDDIEARLNRLERGLFNLADAYVGSQEFFVEFLVHESVLRPAARDLLVNEVKRIMKLALPSNPLTKEEWEKIKLYFEKSERNEITLEEAEEFRRLARKVVREYGHYVEAWKLHLYATMTLAFVRKKYWEERERKKKEKDES